MRDQAVEPLDEPLEFRRLQHFLCVAERRGFTRAATELHLSQQALSSSIAKLETQLGVALLDRSGRQVSLTPAGEVLRDGAEILLAAARTLARQAQDAAVERPRPFVIGHTPAITAEEVHDLLAPLRKTLPAASVTAMQIFPDALQPALLDATIDVALRRGIATPKNLAARVIAYHPLRIAVSHDHPLADRASVVLPDLRDQRIIVWAPPGLSYYTDFILSACRSAGFEPSFAVNRIQGTPPVTAVLDNDGIAFVTAPAGPCLQNQAVVIDIDDPPLAPTQAVWLPHTVSTIRDILTTS
jgi:DNA-binding transcriptional LysR family regulator